MTSNPLVSRLRTLATGCAGVAGFDEEVACYTQAAAEIERLTAELQGAGDKYSQSMGKLAEERDRLRAALERIKANAMTTDTDFFYLSVAHGALSGAADETDEHQQLRERLKNRPRPAFDPDDPELGAPHMDEQL